MAISTFRKFTEEDRNRLEIVAKRFASRWSIPHFDENEGAYDQVVSFVGEESRDRDGNKNMVRAWRRCFARALGEKECAQLTIGYGYVGHYVD
jgi:hypothetical protein